MRDSAFWNVTVPRAMSIYAVLIFVLLWAGFVFALVVNPAWLDALWSLAQALPWLPKIIVWVFFLPIMVGLWIWQSSWPALLRLAGFTAIVAWTLLAVSSFYRAFRS